MRLDAPREDGTTERRHLEALRQMRGEPPPELAAEPPPAVAYLWTAYEDLASGRPATGFAVSPLAWSDMAAWAQLRGVRFSSWEWKVMRMLDSAVVSSLNKVAQDRRAKK